MPNRIQLTSRHDGMVWTVEEITDGYVKVSRPRTEFEAMVEKTPSERWGYCTEADFRTLFGITPRDILTGWV